MESGRNNPGFFLKSGLEASKKYIDLVNQELALYDTANQLLEKFDPLNPECLDQILPQVELEKEKISKLEQAQIDLIKENIKIEHLPGALANKITQILLAAGYEASAARSATRLVLAYLEKVKPESNLDQDIEIYFCYVNSIIVRFVIADSTKIFNKLLSAMSKNNLTLLISYTSMNCISGANRKVDGIPSHELCQEIVDDLYHKNPIKFEKKSVGKNGIYKLEVNNQLSKGIRLCIAKNFTSAFIGELGDRLVYFLHPRFMIAAHEEGHLLRDLKGSSRAKIRQPLPFAIQYVYDTAEEYLNIKLGKTSEHTFSELYKRPKRLTHRGCDLHGSKEEWQKLYLFAMLETGRDISGIDTSALKVEEIIDAYKHRKPTSPLIERLFYRENLEQNDIPALIDECTNPDLIPANKTPLHLLAEFMPFWPEFPANQNRCLMEKFIVLCLEKFPIDQFDNKGKTALMYAIKSHNIDLVTLLLKHGARAFFSLKHLFKINNVVSMAVESGHLEMVKIIIQFLKNTSPLVLSRIYCEASSQYVNPLYVAVKKNQSDIFIYLLQFYSLINIAKIDRSRYSDQRLAYLVLVNFIYYSDIVMLKALLFKLGQENLQKLFSPLKKSASSPFLEAFQNLYKEWNIEHIRILSEYVDLLDLFQDTNGEGKNFLCLAIENKVHFVEDLLYFIYEKFGKEFIDIMLRKVFETLDISGCVRIMEIIKCYNEIHPNKKIELKCTYFTKYTAQLKIFYFEDVLFSPENNVDPSCLSKIKDILYIYYRGVYKLETYQLNSIDKLTALYEKLKHNRHLFVKHDTNNLTLFSSDQYDALIKRCEKRFDQFKQKNEATISNKPSNS